MEKSLARLLAESPLVSEDKAKTLALVILNFLRTRNKGQLEKAFSKMKLADYEILKGELELILQCGGRPPNWV